jgi:putative tributyrin esterase
MAVFRVEFYSEVLDLQCMMNVILPNKSLSVMRRRRPLYQVLWLLHGLSDDHTAWQRWTSIERHVEETDLAVVMPAVGRSFYSDTTYGMRYWTFLTEELPVIARWYFPLSSAREDNFVAGLSIGGYGAFKVAMSLPDRYAAAASLSGALNIAADFEDNHPMFLKELETIWGNLKQFKGSQNDLLYLADSLAASGGPHPNLYAWCGTEDFLYEQNLGFRDYAAQIGLDLLYEEGPGDHSWKYWDQQIQRVLEWLPLTHRYKRKTRK